MRNKLLSQEPGKISRLFKILWGLGFLGGGTIAGVSGAFQMIYYQNYLGLSSKVISVCIVLYTLFNAFNNPFITYISDHTKSKIGRRVPYFRFTPPFVVLSFIMLFFVPVELNLIFTATWFFVCMLVFDLAYSTYCNMYLNLQTEITEYENERIDLQLSCEVSNYIGTVLGMVLPGLITLDLMSSQSLSNFRLLIIIVAVIGFGLMLISSFIVKERNDLKSTDTHKENIKIKSAIKEYRQIFKIKPIRRAVFVNFFANCSINLTTPLLYYIGIFILKIEASLFVIIVMVPTVISLPIWMKIQRKYGAIRTGEIALITAFFGYLVSGLVNTNVVLFISFGITGACIAGIRLTLRNILSDCVDYDVSVTGKRREGVVFGASTFANAFTFMLVAIIPIVLDLTGFITASENGGVNMVNQPMSSIWGIRGLILLAGFFVFVSYLLLKKYTLKGDKLKEVRKAVKLMNGN